MRIESNVHAIPSRLQGKTDPDVPPDQAIPLSGTGLFLFAHGDGQFEKLFDAPGRPPVFEAELVALGVLAPDAGTPNPRVGLLVRLPDGRAAVTSLRLRFFLDAADGLRAALGDPRTRPRDSRTRPR